MPLKLSFDLHMYFICLRKDMMASSGTEKKHQCLILPTVTKNIFNENKIYDACYIAIFELPSFTLCK